jgi:adenylate cyclase
VVIGAVVFVLLAAVVWLDGFRKADAGLYDAIVVATSTGKSQLPITIVGIDEASFAELKLQWPWPRSVHAALIDTLNRRGAAVVALDVVLAEASTREEDAALAGVIDKYRNVVLAADRVYSESSYGKQWVRVDPLPLFQEAGAITGLATVNLDRDLVMRQMPEGRDAFWREILDLLLKRQPDAVPPVANQENRLIAYAGPPRTFPYVSYHEVLKDAERLGPDAFKDQIVMVGRDVKAAVDVGAAQADTFATPHAGRTGMLMPGVEVHANILESAMLGTTRKAATRLEQVQLLLFTVLLSVVLLMRWTPLRGAVIAVGVIAAISALVWLLYHHALVWLPPLAAFTAVALTFVLKNGYAYFVERAARLETRRAFGLYLSPDVVDQIMADPSRLKLGGERRDVTVIFTDLAGFTDLSERLPAEQVASLLNQHFTRMGRIIMRERGTLNRFIGDAIMAFWGAPVEDAAQCDRAVKVAAEMRDEMVRMRAELREQGLPEIYIRIGINSGTAVIGNLGSEDRFDYTAIGDSVNLAARLEGVNKLYGTDILVSQETASRMTDSSQLRFVDRIIVKGKSEPVDVFTLASNQEIIRLSREGFDAYLRQDWNAAINFWRAILALAPADGVAQTLLRRVEQLKLSPPDTAWNGATALEKM